MAHAGKYKAKLTVAGLGVALTISFSAAAQEEKCGTIKDCAQQIVDIATDLKAENKELAERVVALQDSLSKVTEELNEVGPDVYQCPTAAEGKDQGSVGGGAWGFYGCQGQVTTQSSCAVIEFPTRRDYPCVKLGKLRFDK